MRTIVQSLLFRVIAVSSMLAAGGIIAIAVIMGALYRQASENSFSRLLSAHLFNLIGNVDISPDGRLRGAPDLGEMRFTIPGSGWYWSVTILADETQPALRSPSLVGAIDSPSVADVPFDPEFRRNWRTTGLEGEEIEAVESEFQINETGAVARFLVSGNRSELEAEIGAFERTLRYYLSGFGILVIGINALAILLALRPLGRVRRSLALIRQGERERLEGDFPAEIAPLAAETNALIDANRQVVERARTQVGNLAHSLKTPLAVITNEGRALAGSRGRLIADQAETMRVQIAHYLKKARIAAQKDNVAFRTPVLPSLERLVRVLAKLNPALAVGLEAGDRALAFAGEREDLEEMCGNLVENATKWARHSVQVRVSLDERRPGWLWIDVEDDGPGIPEEKAREALARGKRLDETKPGSGLGLSIVSELAEEYGGQFTLDRSPLGGLKASLQLPVASGDLRAGELAQTPRIG